MSAGYDPAMLWLLFVAIALGAPVELPPGELAPTWAPTLAAAGLEPGPVGAGEGVRIVSDGARWHLVVRDVHGVERRATVAIPRTPAAREEVAALAASLLHPVSRVAALPLPELPPLPPATKPAAAAATAAAVTPTAVPDTVTVTDTVPVTAMVTVPVTVTFPVADMVTVTVTLPVPVPVTVPMPTIPLATAIPAPSPGDDPVEIRRPRARVWWAVAPLGLRLRSRVGVSWAPSGWLGVALPQPVRLGLGVEGVLPGELQQLPDEGGNRTMASVEGRALAAWAPGPFELGATAGVSRRTVNDPTDDEPAPAVIGVVGGLAGVRVTVPRLATLRFAAQVERDLTPTDLEYPVGVPAGRLPPLSANLSIAWTGGDGSLRRVRSTANMDQAR
jgi:hypothetical protein